ncbi:hypothetical protein [Lacipirellula sp.]|uniref:hypothetical protein n=1 Tax=Lacipirellula sp. TaxID=2691419 RepID=UPI003D138FB5
MAAEPLIGPDDKPIINLFDLPKICGKPVPEGHPCCDLCDDWMLCLRRTPLELTIPGLDFSAWLPKVSMSADKVLAANAVYAAQFSDSDGTDEWNGTYLAFPHKATGESNTGGTQLTDGDCGFRDAATFCRNPWSWYGDWEGGWYGMGAWGWFGWWWGYYYGLDAGDYTFDSWYDVFGGYFSYASSRFEATHHTNTPRTVYAPAAKYGKNKEFYIDCKVACRLNEEDQPCLQFTLLLRMQFEKAAAGVVGCQNETLGVDACDADIIAEREGNWDGEAYNYCVPLAVTDLIPLADLAWEDLQDAINFNIIPPPVWEEVDLHDIDPAYPVDTNIWMVTGGSYGGAAFPEFGGYRAVGWVIDGGVSEGPCREEAIRCGGGDVEPPAPTFAHGHHRDGLLDCDEGPWVAEGLITGTYYAYNEVCVPDPITFNDGPCTVRVVTENCKVPDGCKTCAPDPEKPYIRVPVVFGFRASGGDCTKTLTPFITACKTIAKIYWSDGQTSTGLDPITHTIRNNANSGDSKRDSITALAVTTDGCYYCYTGSMSCGCCEVTGGGLTVTSLAGCKWQLCASIEPHPFGSNCYGRTPVIEYQYDDVVGQLTDGQCVEIEPATSSTILRWRFRDYSDGCAHDEVIVPLKCIQCLPCCLGSNRRVYLTLAGWAEFENCGGCLSLNGVYLMKLGERGDCTFDYGTLTGDDDGHIFGCEQVGGESYFVIYGLVYCHIEDDRLLIGVTIIIEGGGAHAVYSKEWDMGPWDPIGDPVFGGFPVDCSIIQGDIPLDSFNSYAGGCNPFPSSVFLETEWV